ncbi:MAG: hypothetical protein PHT58_08430 [Eubacteriales bacterium]|nr:hypothetical protein [Eubacteriales bacterium]
MTKYVVPEFELIRLNTEIITDEGGISAVDPGYGGGGGGGGIDFPFGDEEEEPEPASWTWGE